MRTLNPNIRYSKLCTMVVPNMKIQAVVVTEKSVTKLLEGNFFKIKREINREISMK